MNTIMALTKITAAVSDADVLIKLCQAGHLNILSDVFEKLYVPAVVLGEVNAKLIPEEDSLSLDTACSQGWLVVISPEDLESEQILTYRSFIASNQDILDRGELHAAALANELNIEIILSDDRNAKRIIKQLFEKEGLAYWEVLCIYGKINGVSYKELESIHNSVNKVVSQPIGVSFKKLMKKAELKISELISTKKMRDKSKLY